MEKSHMDEAHDEAYGEPAIRVVLMPKDTNAHGTIFGGIILSQIDLAGSVEVRRHTRHPVVTVALEKVVFHEPVFVGDVVSFYARVVRMGRTSATVHVKVVAERAGPPPHSAGARGTQHPYAGSGSPSNDRAKRVQVTEAEVVYVSIDAENEPIPMRGEAEAP